MDRPTLPPVAPGRSALLALLQVERALGDQLRRAEANASQDVEKAEQEAAGLRDQARRRLQQIVLEAERQAVRDVEARARDRVSESRVAIQRWIDATEGQADDLIRAAVLRLVTDDGDGEGA